MKKLITAVTIILTACTLHATDYHVSPNGLDSNKGTSSKPFSTISAAAQVAQPGDVITVHEGVYREQVSLSRGGIADDKRITYQAAHGEKVIIKGSEVLKGWKKVKNNVWKVTLPNSFFGEFNPFGDVISGDWFVAKGRVHYTGAVYLKSAKPAVREKDPLVLAGFDPKAQLVTEADGVYLEVTLDKSVYNDKERKLVTTSLLGLASVPQLPYEQIDGTPCRLDTDYFGSKRNSENPAPGPFQHQSQEKLRLRVWPKQHQSGMFWS